MMIQDDNSRPDDPEAEARRLALAKSMAERRGHVLAERERNAEVRKETTQVSLAVLTDLEKVVSNAGFFVDEASQASADDVTSKLDAAAAAFGEAERALSEGEVAVASYDVRRLQNLLADHKERFRVAQEQLQPKKKFGFRAKKKAASEKKEEDEKDARKPMVATSTYEGCALKTKFGETIVLAEGETKGRDVLLSDMKECVVYISGCPSTLHMTGLSECTVLAGPVATSVFLEDCKNLTLAAACQQLRAHTTTDAYFSLHVTSKAIIEDCRGIRVAPYALAYSSLDSDFSASGLIRQVNNWSSPDDFNWLASDEPSPNWSIVAEQKRQTFSM